MRSWVVGLIILVSLGSAVAADPLEEFFLLDAISKSNAETAAAAQDLRQRQIDMNANIFQNERALERCGNCPEREQIQSKLDEWKNRKKAFEQITWTVLEKFQTSEGLRGWAVSLGLITPEEFYDRNKIPLGQVVNNMRNEGLSERCIDFYKDYAACSKHYGGDLSDNVYGVCRDQFKIFDACRKGDETKITEIQSKMSLRRKGLTVPDVTRTGYTTEVFFGEVPDDFTPPVPPPSFIGKSKWLKLVMVKNNLGTVKRITLKPVLEHFSLYTVQKWSDPENIKREKRALEQELKAMDDAYVLECYYGMHDITTVGGMAYWWDHAPSAAARLDDAFLKVPRSDATPIQPPRTSCPPTLTEAIKIAPKG